MMKLAPVVPLEAKAATSDSHGLTFGEAFGKLGPPILFVAVASMLWTTWLMCLNISPNGTANYLMDTGDFDNGDFWLILRPDPVLLGFTVLCLSVILAMYAIVILRMTLWRNFVPQRRPSQGRRISTTRIDAVLSSQNALKVKRTWQDVTGFNGRWRKHWNSILKSLDLTLQMLTLRRILEYGFAPALCYGYATLVASNALSCAVFILSRSNHSALIEVFTDTIFDMLFAVGSPVLLLVYAYFHFDFDRARERLIMEVTNLVSFDRQARLKADPLQTTNFLLSFDALRTNTWSGLVLQIAINLSFCYRLLRVVQVYSDSRRLALRPSRASKSGGSTKSVAAYTDTTTGSAVSLIQARVPRILAIYFLGVAIIAIIFTHEAIANSTRECEAYPECGTFAYHWSVHRSCPCLAFISVDRAPKAFEEWTNPRDVTASVAALAASGNLLVINIINRRLQTWPNELSRCSNLRYISLMYTGLDEIPSWASGFNKLEYLSIEGKLLERNIAKMPDDLFDNMPMLTNVHLGVHFYLKQLPRLDGLHNLNGLSLALLPSIAEIPDLSQLKNLQRVEITVMASLKKLPNLPDDVSLSMLAIVLSRVCCNGFLDRCDLSLSACMDMDLSSCLPSEIGRNELTESTQQQIAVHNATVCATEALYRGVPMEVLYTGPTQAQVDKCEGVIYRECTFDASKDWSVGHSICLNDRFQVVHCVYSDEAIDLRRREISGKIGAPCTPDVEAWLGCKSIA